MALISEHINSSYQKNISYDQMRKIIVNLGIKKCENNNNSIFQFNQIKNLLLMRIIDTTEKDIPNVDRKSNKRKYIRLQ